MQLKNITQSTINNIVFTLSVIIANGLYSFSVAVKKPAYARLFICRLRKNVIFGIFFLHICKKNATFARC